MSTGFEMGFFSRNRSTRRTAGAALAVWLFAFGAGLANACLLQEKGSHVHGASTTDSVPARAAPVSAGLIEAVSDHDHDHGAGIAKGACLKVCGDQAQSIVKPAFSVDSHDLAPAVRFNWTPPVAALATDAPLPRRATVILGPPARTRFSRLAL